MPSTAAGIKVDPDGQSVTVSITAESGATVTAYTAQDGSSTHTFPVTITEETGFHFVSKGRYVLSAKVDGSDENANGRGDTLTVDLRGGGVETVQVGSAGDGAPGPRNLEKWVKEFTSSTYVPFLGAASYTYNADGTVATATEGGIVTTYAYNGDGSVNTATRSGVTVTYSYNADGSVSGVA